MAFFTIYTDLENYAGMGFDDVQMKRIFGNDPRDRFDYTQRNQPFESLISEKLKVNFTASGDSRTSVTLPDIQVLTRHNTNLFLSSIAYKALKKTIENDGEFIPVTYEKGEGYIFNVLRAAEDVGGLDSALCVKNEWGDIENMGFHEDKLSSYAIFKTKFDGYNNLYCREDVKTVIENAKLKGVIITPELGARFGMTQNQKYSPN